MWVACRGWLALEAVRVELDLPSVPFLSPSLSRVAFDVSWIEKAPRGRPGSKKDVTAVRACASAVTALLQCCEGCGRTQVRVPDVAVCRSGPNCLLPVQIGCRDGKVRS